MVGSHGHSLPEIFHWIITNEGWPGLFRGNAINVIRVAPSKTIEVSVIVTLSLSLLLFPNEKLQTSIHPRAKQARDCKPHFFTFFTNIFLG
jgi:hypothetical protein